ncbi:MBL fold metallo-hydrolase [Vibrio cincinnatiensis]|uniref:MBL fold metallo-hydrolase n=1 Tax=Vibrio cincinnatiensis TaxID=675 RepID=UPI001EE0F9BC|nr:MBL fold metallo-hydrolase [Vibrio cincinnatiensis]MCG3731626.1 MBL fold metallo-hydrolase [Vibrio cincinnatiensis]MCG3738390.1 MBL fold metallo-hydrolase [Vibrio cincinnatiensis]
MKKLTTTLAAGALLLSGQVLASDLTLQQYKPGEDAIFPVTSTLVSGQKDAILFDAQFSVSDGQALVDMLKKSQKKLTMIYITAGDPDYYFGLQPLLKAFPEVKVVSSPSIVEHIQDTKDAKLEYWGKILGDDAPTELFVPQPSTQTTFTLEGHDIEVREMGTYQAYMWVPSLKTVFGGVSLTSGMHVWTADTQTEQARVAWVQSLENMKSLNPERVIPAHYLGDIPEKDKAIDFTIEYLKTFEAALSEAHKLESKKSEKVISIMKEAYPDLPGESDLELGSQVNTGEIKW